MKKVKFLWERINKLHMVQYLAILIRLCVYDLESMNHDKEHYHFPNFHSHYIFSLTSLGLFFTFVSITIFSHISHGFMVGNILCSFYSCYFYCTSITTLHLNNCEKKRKELDFFVSLLLMWEILELLMIASNLKSIF